MTLTVKTLWDKRSSTVGDEVGSKKILNEEILLPNKKKVQRESVEHLEEVLKYGEEVRAPNLLCVIDVEAGLSEGNLETLASHAASSSNSSLVNASPAVGKKKYPSIDPCFSSKPKDKDDFDDDVNEMPISPTVEENELMWRKL